MNNWRGIIAGFIMAGVVSSAMAQVSFTINVSSNRGHSRLACSWVDTIFLSASVPANYDTIYWLTNPFAFGAGGATDTFFVPSTFGNITISLVAIDTDVTPYDTVIVSEVVNIIDKPNPLISVIPQPNVCVSSEVVFKGFFSMSVDSFHWIIDNNIISDGNTEQSYVYSSPGQDTVWLVASNVCGVDTDMVVVTISNTMSPGGIFPQAIPAQACPGTPVRFYVGPPGLNNAYDLTWDFGDGSPTISGHISDVKEVYHFYSTAGSYTASLIVKWEGGACPNDSSVLTVPVTVNATYNPSFSSISSLDSGCVNSQFSFYLNISESENIEFVEWDMGDGSVYYTSSSPFVITHSYSAPGTYNVTAIVHSYCGDTVHVNKTIKVKTSGVPGYAPGIFISSSILCPNEEFIIYVGSSTSDSIIIAFNGVLDTFIGPSVLDTLTASASQGFDTVFVYYQNACGEWDTTFNVVRVTSQVPFVSMNVWSSGNNACIGDSVKVDFSISPIIDLDTVYIDYGDGTVDTLLPINSFLTTYHVYNSPGQYVISATGVKTCLGIKKTVYDYIVIDNNVGPDIQISAFPLPVCAGEPIFLYASGSFMPEDQSAYMWDFGDGNSGMGRTVRHIYVDGGRYDVELVTSACGKSDTTMIKVRVISAPAYDINASATAVCVGNSITFDAIQLGSITANELVWSFGDGTVDSGASVTYTFNDPGTYNVILMAVGDSCSSQRTISVTVTPNVPPVANFIYNYLGDGTTQFFNLSTNATSFVWYFGDGDSSLLPNPVHTYTANGTYTITLIATNPCGFVDTFEQTITITDLSTVDVELVESGSTIVVHPNPIDEFLRIKLPTNYDSGVMLVIRDMTGKIILSQTITENSTSVNTSSLTVGTYIGQLINLRDGSIVWTGKIVKIID